MANSNKSWGHRILPLPDSVREMDEGYLAGRHTGGYGTNAAGERSYAHADMLDGDPKPEYTWCSRTCHNRCEFVFEYHYVTGRMGRHSSAQKMICREHAERAAAKYGVPMPEAVPHA